MQPLRGVGLDNYNRFLKNYPGPHVLWHAEVLLRNLRRERYIHAAQAGCFSRVRSGLLLLECETQIKIFTSISTAIAEADIFKGAILKHTPLPREAFKLSRTHVSDPNITSIAG